MEIEVCVDLLKLRWVHYKVLNLWSRADDDELDVKHSKQRVEIAINPKDEQRFVETVASLLKPLSKRGRPMVLDSNLLEQQTQEVIFLSKVIKGIPPVEFSDRVTYRKC